MIKNKFLIITIIVAIFSILIVPSTSKASVAFEAINSDYDYYNVPNFPDPTLENAYLYGKKSKNFIYIEDGYFYLYMCYHAQTLLCSMYEGGSFFLRTIYTSTSYVQEDAFIYKCPVNDISGGWQLESRNRYNSTDGYSFNATAKIIYSSIDIKYINSSEVFFPQTPTSMGVKLGQPMQVQDLLKMTKKLMTIITPIGLAIFSTVLVIFLLKSKKWRRF